MSRIPVILDMNLTEEFAAGFFTILENKNIDLLGISLCFGETDLETARNNTAGMLDLFGKDIEVALGAKMPLMANYSIPLKKLYLSERINGLLLDTDAPIKISELIAADFIYDKLTKSSEKVTLLCAGPLTNIALLLQRHPDAVEYVKELVWCGGTARHANIGIVKDTKTFMDPDAASLVMSYGINMTVCPIDIGEKFYATKEEIDAQMLAEDEIVHQKNRLLKKLWCDKNAAAPLFQRNKNLPLQDVAAVLYVTNPELFKTQGFFAEVDRKGRVTYGMFVVHCWNDEPRHGDEPNINLIRDIDRDAAIKYLY